MEAVTALLLLVLQRFLTQLKLELGTICQNSLSWTVGMVLGAMEVQEKTLTN